MHRTSENWDNPSFWRVSEAEIALAKDRLITGFAFVGLTHEWDLSVCLFHAKFGGACNKREFQNIRSAKDGWKVKEGVVKGDGKYNNTEIIAQLHGWVDP